MSFLRYGVGNFRCCILREVCLRIPEYGGVVWSGVVLLRRKPENPWSSKHVSWVPLYASAPIAYDGPVYARRCCKVVAWLYLDLGISQTAHVECYPLPRDWLLSGHRQQYRSRWANPNERVNDVTSPAGRDLDLQLAECVVHWIYCCTE